jgi:ceramide glucosyltransferase
LFPLALIVALMLKASRARWLYTVLYFGHSALALRHINRAYLERATPQYLVWLAPLVEIVFPVQLLVALLSRQRIVWRGHVMQVEHGGGFRFVRRRDMAP